MARRTIGLFAFAAALSLPAASAIAAERYAEPGGDGPAATCPQADPCDLDTAVENAAVADGDEVIVTPGTYTVAQLAISDAITLHGQASQPRPVINTSTLRGLSITDAATIRDLTTVNANQSAISVGAGGVLIERVSATSTSGGAMTCWIEETVTIRDSICHGSSATNSNGIGSNSGLLAGDRTITLRNVTAVGSTGGLNFGYGGSGVNVTIDAKGVIASGTSYDIAASASSNATIVVNVQHSNYNQEFQNGTTGGTASITDPGTGTGNQTALPLFVNAAGGDFRQSAGSPTIDAGVLDSFSGSADFEGDPRTVDGDGVCPPAPDIGADEYVPGSATDCDPPETSINGGPTGVTSDTTPTFDLVSDEGGSTFECRIDTGTFAPCTTPYTTPALSSGPHTLEVRATDSNANTDPTPASRTFTVDAIPPDTSITGGPTGPTSDPTPSFDLSSDETGATFECRIDAGAFAPCSSPHTTGSLTDGSHTLEVRATDPAGNVDPSPASRTFGVDTNPPDTSISGGPAGLTRDATPTFDLESGDSGATFECRVDAAAFAPCASPHTTAPLGNGDHTIEVRAVDLAGNADTTPATRTFSVDSRSPETTITAAPKAKVKTKRNRVRVKFEFSADESATFQCALDGEAYAPCTSPLTVRVRKGKHTFAVRATDAAGNADGSPATAEFKVKRKRK